MHHAGLRRPLVLLMTFGVFAAAAALLLDALRRHFLPPQRLECQALVDAAARRHGLDPMLIKAVIRQESDFNPNARGAAGEIGLMQVTRDAARDWERLNGRQLRWPGALFDPALNIEIGAWYLARALRQWRGQENAEVLALIQYNAGRQRARRWLREYGPKNVAARIPFASTRTYINNVFSYRQHYRRSAHSEPHGTTDDN